jgi:dTDP-4-dehydrorhamnose reductase
MINGVIKEIMVSSIFNNLVVGIDGTIGSALFAHLLSMNVNVWGTTRRKSHAQSESIFYLNLADPPESWQFPSIAFDVVYICAGLCKMAACEEAPELANRINVVGTFELARRLSQSGALIIFLSTNQVFSGKVPLVAANAAYQPLNEYGRQKAKTEQLIKTTCQKWAIVRLSKVIEDYMPLLQTWYNRLLSRQSIEAFYDMWLAPVLLEQVIKVLIKIGQEKGQGYFQLSGTNDISYQELANQVADYLERPRSLVQAISAIDKGIKENFLPRFTSLECTSTLELSGEKMPNSREVIQKYFKKLNEK